jgi:hypothetical protein
MQIGGDRLGGAAPKKTFLFIVGRGRSGTTLLRAMFDSHPDMAIPPESYGLVRFGRSRQRYEREDGFNLELFVEDAVDLWNRKWGLPENELASVLSSARPTTVPEATRAMFSAYAQRQGKRRYGDKTPHNVMQIAFLGELFPEARFVHIIRDGRDVTLSFLSVDFGAKGIGEGAISWKRTVEQGRRGGARLGGDRYREVKYEDLVRDPNATLSELCSFADLPFDPLMLRYFERADEVLKGTKKAVHTNISRPPTKIRDWRVEMRPADIALFEALAGSSLERFGYPRVYQRVPTWARLRARLAIGAVRVRSVERRSVKLRKAFGKRLRGVQPRG